MKKIGWALLWIVGLLTILFLVFLSGFFALSFMSDAVLNWKCKDNLDMVVYPFIFSLCIYNCYYALDFLVEYIKDVFKG